MKQLVESFYAWYRHSLRNPKYRWLIIFGTLTYLLSPIDISPDVFPLVGWIDDGILLTLLITEIAQLFQERVSSSADDQDSDKAPSNIPDNATVVDVDAQEVP
ncbi:DUF1232 domain-containing protein [Leptolyngbya cf. ectocarpi LEGE 11479]|uniref:DUF1232 domain-containing protein n=1 Tax=Leptolyngbya cf. ectocarpi LEGE 11479 TaxID=1828722 RepID=A0A929FCB2_LEPEC|nr:YkvA family protein [Leptolyngbya ectocarpi]MBE9069398.1 DUF1232 domain-containing protein [Leptolyngbya cf. ectocarpi LEGE 11479]